MIKREIYSIEDSKLVRQRRFCPRCGPGVFLAEHADRYACGRCNYTEIKKETKPKREAAETKVKSAPKPKSEAKPKPKKEKSE